MPKKKQSSDFIIFENEWRKLNSNNLQRDSCIQQAGRIWQLMNRDERKSYFEKARKLRVENPKNINIINELQLRQTKQQIEKIVKQSVENAELETQCYYFIMINYFTKSVCSPAELAASKFSLAEGVQSVYHTLINPGVKDYGDLYDTQEHANTTHQLPLPPHALGKVNLKAVYADLLDFLRTRNGAEAKLPPVFTQQNQMTIVSRALKFLNDGVVSQLNVYPIEYLFYIMKEATCVTGQLPPPGSIHITNSMFQDDAYEFLFNISCEYHQQCYRVQHCAKSYVTRWGYRFSECMCNDLAIRMHPYRHSPDPLTITEPNSIYAPEEQQISEAEKVDSQNEDIIEVVEPLCPDVLDTLNNLDLDNIFEEENNCRSDEDDKEDAKEVENNMMDKVAEVGNNLSVAIPESVVIENIISDSEEEVDVEFVEENNNPSDVENILVELSPKPTPIPTIFNYLSEQKVELSADESLFTRRSERPEHNFEPQTEQLNQAHESIASKVELPSPKETNKTDEKERPASDKVRYFNKNHEILYKSRWRSRSLSRDSQAGRRSSSSNRNDFPSRRFGDGNILRDRSVSPTTSHRRRKLTCRPTRDTLSHLMAIRQKSHKTERPTILQKMMDKINCSRKRISRDISPEIYISHFNVSSGESKNISPIDEAPIPIETVSSNRAITPNLDQLSRSAYQEPHLSPNTFNTFLYGLCTTYGGISHPRPPILNPAEYVLPQPIHSQPYSHHTNYKTPILPNPAELGAPPPALRPYDLRHRLEQSRVSDLSPYDLRHMIPVRIDYNRPSGDMMSYLQQGFPTYQYNPPAWESHQLPPWHFGYGTYLPNMYY